jgi:hypothetical protein
VDYDKQEARRRMQRAFRAAAVADAIQARRDAGPMVQVGKPSKRGAFKAPPPGGHPTARDRTLAAQAAKAGAKPPPVPKPVAPPSAPSARDRALVAGAKPWVGEDLHEAQCRVEAYDAYREGRDAEEILPPLVGRVKQYAAERGPLSLAERFDREGMAAYGPVKTSATPHRPAKPKSAKKTRAGRGSK